MEQPFTAVFREMALSLPGVYESVSYGTPSFKIKDKLLARFHEDGTSLVLKLDMDTRDFLLQTDPEAYYITDHYRKYPYVLVSMDRADPAELRGHLYSTWKAHATKKQVQAYEQTR